MSNEVQYYEPIIQAMMNLRARQQQAQQLQAQVGFQKQQQALEQQRLGQQQQQIENEYNYHKESLENQHQITQATLAQGKLAQLRDAQKMIQSGASPDAFRQPGISGPGIMGNPGGTPQGMIDVPGVGQIPQDSLGSPEKYIQLQRDIAAGKSEGEAAGAFPYQKQLAQINANNELNLAGVNHTNRLLEIKQQGGNALDLERIRSAGEDARTRMQVNGHIRGVMIANTLDPLGNGDPENTANIMENKIYSILNAQAGYKDSPKNEKKYIDSWAAQNHIVIPTDQKAWAKSLDSISQMDGLLDKAREMAQKYSRDAPGGNNLARWTGGLVGGTMPGGDLDSEMKSFNSMAGSLANFYDEQKRSSDATMLRQVIGLVDPRATVQENMGKINDHAKMLNKVVQNTFAGMPNSETNLILHNRGIGNFGGFKNEPQASSMTIPKGAKGFAVHMSDGTTRTVPNTPENLKQYGVQEQQ